MLTSVLSEKHSWHCGVLGPIVATGSPHTLARDSCLEMRYQQITATLATKALSTGLNYAPLVIHDVHKNTGLQTQSVPLSPAVLLGYTSTYSVNLALRHLSCCEAHRVHTQCILKD